MTNNGKAFKEEFKNCSASVYVPLSEHFENAYGDFYTSLQGHEEGKESVTKYLHFDAKSQPVALTDFAALSLLTPQVSYLIKREPMMIDSHAIPERPFEGEKPAKSRRLDQSTKT